MNRALRAYEWSAHQENYFQNHQNLGGITQPFHDEIANELEIKQQELSDRLKLLTNDNKSFQVTASYLLDLAQRAEQLFKESDESLRQKLLAYLLSNIELNDKKLSYILNSFFREVAEAKKKSQTGSESNIWCGYRDSNPGPLPWQGSALSAELHPHIVKSMMIASGAITRPADDHP